MCVVGDGSDSLISVDTTWHHPLNFKKETCNCTKSKILHEIIRPNFKKETCNNGLDRGAKGGRPTDIQHLIYREMAIGEFGNLHRCTHT